MNRIIVIGNGFDKAHGLATGYKDFIDDYWNEFGNVIYKKYEDHVNAQLRSNKIGTKSIISHEDEFVRFEIFKGGVHVESMEYLANKHKGTYGDILKRIYNFHKKSGNYYNALRITFKNNFLKHISNRCYLTNWVDIENEYYGKLKELLDESDAEMRHQKVLELNQDFDAVKKSLEKYLQKVSSKNGLKTRPTIQNAFKRSIDLNEISINARDEYIELLGYNSGIFEGIPTLTPFQKRFMIQKRMEDTNFKTEYCRPDNILFLNFNYTDIAEHLYADTDSEVINIHGALDNPHNPIIFGYGDELDEDYRQIEKLQDNDFLENIKSIRYHETGNYRRLLDFLETRQYQVVVMGHSCGNSDRTLLNTLFEHPNCASVKVYYHQIDENTDNYSQIVRNISRNFNDKAAMRDKVVNKKLCTPLVPIKDRA